VLFSQQLVSEPDEMAMSGGDKFEVVKFNQIMADEGEGSVSPARVVEDFKIVETSEDGG